MHQVSLTMLLLLPWLADLHQRSRWFEPDKPLRTLGIGLASLLLLLVLVGTWPHRIEANAELVTDSTQLISAPGEGSLQELGVSLCDEIQANAMLGRPDVRDLLSLDPETGVDLRGDAAEADRARAQGELAGVEIVQARLDKVLFFATGADQGTFRGVVVEGVGATSRAPVRQGDRLFA